MIDRSSDSGADVGRWIDALDEIERHLDRSELFLGESTETNVVSADGDQYCWSAPTGLGPIPSQLEARALALLDRLARTERALSDQAALTSRRMASVNRPDPRRKTSSGSRFDSVC